MPRFSELDELRALRGYHQPLHASKAEAEKLTEPKLEEMQHPEEVDKATPKQRSIFQVIFDWIARA